MQILKFTKYYFNIHILHFSVLGVLFKVSIFHVFWRVFLVFFLVFVLVYPFFLTLCFDVASCNVLGFT